MAFDAPAPDLNKLIAAWEEFESGEQTPGKVLSKMKTAGLAQVLAQLVATGWTPTAGLASRAGRKSADSAPGQLASGQRPAVVAAVAITHICHRGCGRGCALSNR